jgi:hypothetical protein
MALKVGGTTVVNDSRALENISNLKTVGGQSILGSGNIPLSSTTGVTISETQPDPTTSSIWIQPPVETKYWVRGSIDGTNTAQRLVINILEYNADQQLPTWQKIFQSYSVVSTLPKPSVTPVNTSLALNVTGLFNGSCKADFVYLNTLNKNTEQLEWVLSAIYAFNSNNTRLNFEFTIQKNVIYMASPVGFSAVDFNGVKLWNRSEGLSSGSFIHYFEMVDSLYNPQSRIPYLALTNYESGTFDRFRAEDGQRNWTFLSALSRSLSVFDAKGNIGSYVLSLIPPPEESPNEKKYRLVKFSQHDSIIIASDIDFDAGVCEFRNPQNFDSDVYFRRVGDVGRWNKNNTTIYPSGNRPSWVTGVEFYINGTDEVAYTVLSTSNTEVRVAYFNLFNGNFIKEIIVPINQSGAKPMTAGYTGAPPSGVYLQTPNNQNFTIIYKDGTYENRGLTYNNHLTVFNDLAGYYYYSTGYLNPLTKQFSAVMYTGSEVRAYSPTTIGSPFTEVFITSPRGWKPTKLGQFL